MVVETTGTAHLPALRRTPFDGISEEFPGHPRAVASGCGFAGRVDHDRNGR